jgi:hypothetical protein
MSAEVAKVTPEHIKKQLQVYLKDHIANLGLKWNKEADAFLPIIPPTPPAVPAEQQTENVGQSLVPTPITPSINAPVTEDLFAAEEKGA